MRSLPRVPATAPGAPVRRRVPVAILSVGLLCAASAAQAVRGGDLVTANYSPAVVYRVTPSGAVSPLLAGAPAVGPSGVAVLRSRDVLVADFLADALIRIDAAGNASVVASRVGGPLRVAEDRDGTWLVTAGTTRALVRVTSNGVVTPIASGAPLVRPFDVAVDPGAGYLVVDDLGAGLYSVTPAGLVTPIHVGLPFRLPQGVALFADGDYAVFDGLTDSLFRVDRATGAVTTFVTNAALGGNPCGIVEDFEGGCFVSQSGAGGSRIVHVDGAGSVVPVASGAPFTNLEDIARVPILRGPNGLSTGPGAPYTVDLDDPTAPNLLYSIALSASVAPGWGLPAGDPRSLTINPDALFFATILSDVPPLLVGWFALTDATGRANATFDLRTLPPGVLSGVRLFAQALEFDASAQNGIHALTNVLPFDFR